MRMRAFVPLVIFAAATLVLLLSIRQIATMRALAFWVMLVTALTLISIVAGQRDADPREASRFEAALRRPKQPATEQVQLVRLERELSLGVASAGHARRRLLPRLRAIATARLYSRHGIELERRPDAARALLGEDVWELLRPDRPSPEHPREPGVPHRRVVAVIERLESL